MKRERILKVVLVVVGVLFSAGIYPLLLSLRQEPALAMMLSLIPRHELVGVATLIVIGVVLILLASGKQPVERASALGA